MAGDWIKLQKDTPDKPEVLAMSARLNIDPDAVVGKLVRIWSWFDTHTANGNAESVTFSFIDRLTSVTGFAEQMMLTGWLVQNGSLLSLPNFDYHNGKTAKTRALGNKRQENFRKDNDESDDFVTLDALPEKRREEKRILIPNTLQSETKFPPCPHEQILNLWKKHLPHLTQPRTWEGQRQANLKNRWIQASKSSSYSNGYIDLDQGLAWWDSFFQYIANDTKLSSGFEGANRTWKPDLEWVINATNFQKIIDGKYNK